MIFGFTQNISDTIEIISQVFCWGIAGLCLGWGISTFVPNYSKKTAMIAGLLGGIIGGAVFLFSQIFMPVIYSHLIGVSIIGFFIGLMISFFEELLREAWLTVEYSKNEKRNISLGSKPIVLGSSPLADIYLPTKKYLPETLIFEIRNSKVIVENKINNQVFEVRNGSKIQLGSIMVIVNTRSVRV